MYISALPVQGCRSQYSKSKHPGYKAEKTYTAKTKPCRARVLEAVEGESRIEIIIVEGRNRQVRKMFEAVGKEVTFLKRAAVGGLRLGGLARGAYRKLTEREIEVLRL